MGDDDASELKLCTVPADEMVRVVYLPLARGALMALNVWVPPESPFKEVMPPPESSPQVR